VKRLDVSPPSDGAAAVILAGQRRSKKLTEPVWLDGGAELEYPLDERDLAYPEYGRKRRRWLT